MKKSMTMIGLMSVVTLLAVSSTLVHAQGPPIEAGHVIVRFTDPTLPAHVDSLLGDFGVTPEQSLRDSATYLVGLPAGMTIETAILAFSDIPAVTHAGPNYVCGIIEGSQMSQAFLDGDSETHATGVSPTEFYAQDATNQVEMSGGHQVATGVGQVVAHLDNGIDFDHPLFSGRLLPDGYDFIDDDNDPTYTTGEHSGHGTFAAGLIALFAPDAAVLPIRTLDGDGLGTVFGAVQGIEHAIVQNSNVVVMGFGLDVDDPILHTAIRQCDSAGVVMVAASGNNNTDTPLRYPAAYDEVIGVGAVDGNDVKATFSNFGATVDVCAPGVDLYSSLPGGDVWGTWSGTSFATPIVGALAAMVTEVRAGNQPFMIRTLISWGCDPIDSLNPSYADALGRGRVDFAQTLPQDTSIAIVWGSVSDSSGNDLSNIQFIPEQNGEVITRSVTVTDSNGFYASAIPYGVYNFIFDDSVSQNRSTTEYTDFAVECDTALNTVLSGSQPLECGAPGDLTGDGVADASDLNAVIGHVFYNQELAETPAGCSSPGDTNCDGFADAVDVNRLIQYIFFNGSTPATQCP